MKFCLMINAKTQWETSNQLAIEMAQSIIKSGHSITAIFFYGQAIQIVKNTSLTQQWQQWQNKSHVPLLLCSTLIENQQLTDTASQIPGFETVSMGRLVQAMEIADRTVELN